MKTLIFVRHAHRDTSKGRELNNGLSAKGIKQREKLTSHYLRYFKNIKPVLYSSPSKRCIETLENISNETKSKTKILDDLSELQMEESSSHFRTRIEHLIDKCLLEKAPVVICCSHGDWIPEACDLLCGLSIDLSKSGWVEFDVKHKSVTLKNLIQKFE